MSRRSRLDGRPSIHPSAWAIAFRFAAAFTLTLRMDWKASGDMEKQRTATISFNDGAQPIEFPVLSGTIGPDVVDIRTLLGKAGKFTYDPGLIFIERFVIAHRCYAILSLIFL